MSLFSKILQFPGPVPPDRDCVLPDLILAAGLLDPAQLVGADQLFEVVHPLPEVFSLIGLLHEDAMILRFQNVLLGDDVDVLIHGLFRADERLMGTQGHGAAGVDQCIARNARLLMIGAAETAVDDHETSPALDGALTVFLLHGDMAVDDVAGAGQAKLR